jgi:hypothetical protein
VGNSHTYQAGIDTDGEVYVGWNQYVPGNTPPTVFHYLGSKLTDLRPNQEDVALQFDVFGNSLTLFAWRPYEPKPTQPTVTVIDNQIPGQGTVAIMHHPNGTGFGSFRYVNVDNSPIPEPQSFALGSLGFVALAGFAFRTRLNRIG